MLKISFQLISLKEIVVPDWRKFFWQDLVCVFQIKLLLYSLLAESHNTPVLPPKKICVGIVLDLSWDIFIISGEIANNDYGKVWGVKEVHYGINLWK